MTPFTNLGTNSASTLDWLEVSKHLRISELLHGNCSVVEPVFAQVATDPTQTTPAGMEIPVPSAGDFFSDLQKASKSQKAAKDLILDAIHVAVDGAASTPEGNPKPTNAAIAAVAKLLAVVPDFVLGEPDVDVFGGEIHLQWSKDTREIVLMAFSKDKEPLVHHYERVKGKASEHGIEKATAARLEKWLRWLNG